MFICCFVLVYAPLIALISFADYYAHALDTILVLIAVLLATLIPAWIAYSKVRSYPGTDAERCRENLGWYLIAISCGLIFIARVVYAQRELTETDIVTSVPVADALFGLSVLFLLAGLLAIPWSRGKHRRVSQLLTGTIVLVSTATISWPILIGPAVAGELQEVIDLLSLSNYLIAVFLLMATVLWIILNEVREDLWPTAVAFVISIGFMILIQVGYLSFLIASDLDQQASVSLLLVNAATVVSFLMIALAGLLRVGSLHLKASTTSEADLINDDRLIPFWQVILPYPVLLTLLAVRLAMEIFDWQNEYRSGMVVGVTIIIVLMMIWQIPLLRFNQDLYRRLMSSSIRDGLTGLFTHRALHDLLHAELARAARNEQPVAVLFLDIDRFKRFNDTYGHIHGDQVLVSVADILRENVRRSDYAGRYGGEEFVVIAPGIDREDAKALAERVRIRLQNQPFIFDGQTVSMTMSVGIAVYPHDSTDAEELIDLADDAMYLAKESGRNQTMMHKPLEVFPA